MFALTTSVAQRTNLPGGYLLGGHQPGYHPLRDSPSYCAVERRNWAAGAGTSAMGSYDNISGLEDENTNDREDSEEEGGK